MNTILLDPTDVLFFRDGRPMGGASSGHGAAWPLPNIVSHAFHAALHRAELDEGSGLKLHGHNQTRRTNGGLEELSTDRPRRFGSLHTAGPFPVRVEDPGGKPVPHDWYFPRPADAGDDAQPYLFPLLSQQSAPSSLRSPCRYPVASRIPPSKTPPESWWNADAWQKYLGTHDDNGTPNVVSDSSFADTEHSYGIEINPTSGAVVEGQFYSAHYLRLRPGWRMGVLALAKDKKFEHEKYGSDLVQALLNGSGAEIIAGGQQRVCTATIHSQSGTPLPLPRGLVEGFPTNNAKSLVKWILITPAIWPHIEKGTSVYGDPIYPHSGGWLPNWIAEVQQLVGEETVEPGGVLLLDGPGRKKAERTKQHPGRHIEAKLVAAIVPKPLPVTGYALPNEKDSGRQEGGAKPTHLAVPAGAVYYFEADSPEEAKKLAAALNWHGDGDETSIRNRRSTLMGEKGFGLGVCGAWDPYPLADTNPAS